MLEIILIFIKGWQTLDSKLGCPATVLKNALVMNDLYAVLFHNHNILLKR